jgi:hypothetical protein
MGTSKLNKRIFDNQNSPKSKVHDLLSEQELTKQAIPNKPNQKLRQQLTEKRIYDKQRFSSKHW